MNQKHEPQSPIEQQLAAALSAEGVTYECQHVVEYQHFSAYCRSKYRCRCGLDRQTEDGEWEEGNHFEDSGEDCDWAVEEKTVPRYVVDFAVMTPDGPIAIECDGKEYHNGPRIPLDRQRQARIEELGWVVVRFTGAQIYRDARGCARQVVRAIDRLRVMRQKERKSSCGQQALL